MTHLLEVDELGLVGVEHEAPPVVAHRVAADVGLRVLKLLFHVAHQHLAVQAQEGGADQLRVHWVGAHHLTTDPDQRTDPGRRQLTDPDEGTV